MHSFTVILTCSLQLLLKEQKGALKEQIERIYALIQEQSERMQRLRDEIGKVPNVDAELAKLTIVINEWALVQNRVRCEMYYTCLLLVSMHILL